MTTYDIALFIHMIGVIAMFSGFAIYPRARGSVSRELALRVADPLPWTVLTAVNGLAIGIVFVMSTKPGWAVSIGVTAGTAIIDAAVGARMARSAEGPEVARQVAAL